MDGTGLRFETIEHGGEYPDTMPQAIKLVDAEGRSGRRDIGRRVALDHATESDLRGISGLPPDSDQTTNIPDWQLRARKRHRVPPSRDCSILDHRLIPISALILLISASSSAVSTASDSWMATFFRSPENLNGT